MKNRKMKSLFNKPNRQMLADMSQGRAVEDAKVIQADPAEYAKTQSVPSLIELPGIEHPKPVDGLFDRKNFELHKYYTAGEDERMVDLTSFNDGPLIIAVESISPLLRYTIPDNMNLIIQQYSFWLTVNNSPVQPVERNIFAEPLEFYQYYDFIIRENGRSIIETVTQSGQLWAPAAGYDGFSVLTQNPGESSDPNHGGVTIVIKARSQLEISVRHNRAVAAGARDILGAGCRIRGFLTSNKTT